MRCAVFFLIVFLTITAAAHAADPQDNTPFPTSVFDGPLPPKPAPDLFLLSGFTPKNLLPRPWPSLVLRRPSGYIPPPCRKLYDLKRPDVLDCWLSNVPAIGDAISWEFESGRLTRWSFWNDAAKADLRADFQRARLWRAAGFGPWPGPPWTDPPVNREEPFLAADEFLTVLDSDQAWRQYVAQVAISLAAEIDAWVPWSLRDYSREVLGELFRPDLTQYRLDRDDGSLGDSVYHGHIATGGLAPAHPATIYRFLLTNGILRATPKATIGGLIEWSRDNMRHQFAIRPPLYPVDLSPGAEFAAFWHYRGFPPVLRILEGTQAEDPVLGVLHPGIHSWTTGCTGTSRFMRAVLRVANIPVTEILARRTCGHAMPYFAGEGFYLSHGDDPYNTWSSSGSFTGEELLVSSDLWHRWFPEGDEETSCRNVGRRVLELNFDRPSDALVSTYCQDQTNGRSAADSDVFASMGRVYSMERLLEAGFWESLASLAETSTTPSCVHWRIVR
jgi:hypothetical protein